MGAVGNLDPMPKTVHAPTPASGTGAQAALFGLLADPLRLRIVQSLASEQLCTCHLMDITGARQTTISHHLRLLRQAGVILGEADGRFTWYRLVPGSFSDALQQLATISDAGTAPRRRETCAT